MKSKNGHVSWVRVARERHGLSQRDLAEISEIGQSTICRVESRAGIRPHASTRRLLADALGYDVEDLWPANGRTRNRELREWTIPASRKP